MAEGGFLLPASALGLALLLCWLASPSVMAALRRFSFPWMWEMFGILTFGPPGLTPTPPGTRTKKWTRGLEEEPGGPG